MSRITNFASRSVKMSSFNISSPFSHFDTWELELSGGCRLSRLACNWETETHWHDPRDRRRLRAQNLQDYGRRVSLRGCIDRARRSTSTSLAVSDRSEDVLANLITFEEISSFFSLMFVCILFLVWLFCYSSFSRRRRWKRRFRTKLSLVSEQSPFGLDIFTEHTRAWILACENF